MSTAYYERLVQEDLDCGNSTTTKRNPGGGTLSATQVNLATFAVSQLAATVTWDPPDVPAGGKESTTVTVTGAALGDIALASFSLDVQELTMTANVSATNTVEVVLCNLTGSSVNLGSGTLKVLVFAVKS
jgi:hypothetical protein